MSIIIEVIFLFSFFKTDYLQHDTDKLITIKCCFSCHNFKAIIRYIQVLRSVSSNDKAFQGIVKNLVEVTHKTQIRPKLPLRNG